MGIGTYNDINSGSVVNRSGYARDMGIGTIAFAVSAASASGPDTLAIWVLAQLYHKLRRSIFQSGYARDTGIDTLLHLQDFSLYDVRICSRYGYQHSNGKATDFDSGIQICSQYI